MRALQFMFIIIPFRHFNNLFTRLKLLEAGRKNNVYFYFYFFTKSRVVQFSYTWIFLLFGCRWIINYILWNQNEFTWWIFIYLIVKHPWEMYVVWIDTLQTSDEYNIILLILFRIHFNTYTDSTEISDRNWNQSFFNFVAKIKRA